jgi:hypothetical protein
LEQQNLGSPHPNLKQDFGGHDPSYGHTPSDIANFLGNFPHSLSLSLLLLLHIVVSITLVLHSRWKDSFLRQYLTHRDAQTFHLEK